MAYDWISEALEWRRSVTEEPLFELAQHLVASVYDNGPVRGARPAIGDDCLEVGVAGPVVVETLDSVDVLGVVGRASNGCTGRVDEA